MTSNSDALFDGKKEYATRQAKDASPKGSWDEGVTGLLGVVNAHPHLYSTSSCSGRVSIYVEGPKGRKGGGEWLFVTHAFSEFAAMKLDELDVDGGGSEREIVMKFEPMILHLCARNAAMATKALGMAISCGFRESGMVPQKGRETVMVGIRSSLRLEIPLGSVTPDGAALDLKLDQAYLLWLQHIVERKFAENEERIHRLERGFREL